jgi:DNA-binding NtrC family response regulator
MPCALLLAQDGTARRRFEACLRGNGFEVLTAGTPIECLELAGSRSPDVIVVDDRLPEDPSGIEILRALRSRHLWNPVVMVTGAGIAHGPVDTSTLGPTHPVSRSLLDSAEQALKAAVPLRVTHSPSTAREPWDAASALLGNSYAIRTVRAQVRRLSGSGGNVLIEGETGTGKELVARAIHECGPRARAALVAVNTTLLDSIFRTA